MILLRMNPYFFTFEFGTVFSFLAILYHERENKRVLEMLALAFCYGIILEALNIYMSHAYEYSRYFIFQISGVPLAIGAGWAIVYYLSQNAAKRFGLAWWQEPFLMALIAFSYDLSLDVIAIRLGFWSWNIPLNEEWFGVPYDNFYGWLAVVWTFGFFVNLSYQASLKPQFARVMRYASPIISALLLGTEIMIYESFAAVLSGQFTWGETMALYNQKNHYYAYVPEVRAMKIYLFLFIVAALLSVCAGWIYKRKKTATKIQDNFPFHLSLAVHAIFIIFLFESGIYKVSWLLVFVSFFVLALNIIVKIPPGDFRNWRLEGRRENFDESKI